MLDTVSWGKEGLPSEFQSTFGSLTAYQRVPGASVPLPPEQWAVGASIEWSHTPHPSLSGSRGLSCTQPPAIAPGMQSYLSAAWGHKSPAPQPRGHWGGGVPVPSCHQPFPSNRFWAVGITHACQVAGRVPVWTGQWLLQSQEHRGEGKEGAAWGIYVAFIS